MDYSQDTCDPEKELKALISFWANAETETPLYEYLHVGKEELASYFKGELHAGFIVDRYLSNGGVRVTE